MFIVRGREGERELFSYNCGSQRPKMNCILSSEREGERERERERGATFILQALKENSDIFSNPEPCSHK